jgi:hypothetical protein
MRLNKKPAEIDAIELRRDQVARLRARRLTVRQIVEALAAERCLNPTTGRPWSVGTIDEDLKVVLRRWKSGAVEAMENHVAEQLAQLNEVKRQGFENGELQAVLGALKHEARLLGIEAPEKVAVSHSGMPAITEMLVMVREEEDGNGSSDA